jgi:proteasome-associated ATPase
MPDAEDSFEEGSDAEDINGLSALQLFDFLIYHFFEAGVDQSTLRLLRDRIEEMEEVQDQARSAVEQLSAVVDKLKSPALRLGTLLQRMGENRALVCVGGTDYVCSVDPSLPVAVLETGMRMLLNEAFAVIDSFGYDKGGPIVRISEVLSDGRLRVGSEHGLSDAVVLRSSLLSKEKLKPGLDVRLDPNQRMVTEIFAQGKRIDRSLSTVTEVTWEDVGGQWEAIEAIRDTIEMPYLHAHLFKRFNHPVPKGFLLYGPPGCGKTLMGKATAYNLRLQIRAKNNEDHPEFFLHVKGPEILNMWLGESERQVRDLFMQCREKAAGGELAFLFIDEAESILGTRTGSRSGGNILSTLVPMFCAEMDGIEPLENVVVILASNRADLIDPAILRPGRVDRKIRVRRPDRAAAREIYRIYLTSDLPLAEPRDAMVEAALESHFAETEENRFLEITYRSGRHEYLHRGAMASGALIAGVVERAKELAIKRTVREEEEESQLRTADLLEALDLEHAENELFPPTEYTEDWLKLTDFDPSNVINLKPFRQKSGSRTTASI